MASYEPNQPYEITNINRTIRHVVPPPDFSNDLGKRQIVVFNQGVHFSLTSTRYGDPDLLAEISRCQPLRLEHVMVSWQYHQRALAQDILPFLFLGPMSVARDSEVVRANGITMLLAVRDGKAAKTNPKIMNPARFESGKDIHTATFDVLDEFDLVQRFPSAIKMMVDHLKAKTKHRPVGKLEEVGGRILVFCEAGDKRSASLVVLFFMVVFGLSTTEAIQAVQSRRYGIVINGDLFRMIKNCEDILQAERQVAMNAVTLDIPAKQPFAQSHKRSIDQAWDDDEAMEDVDYGAEKYRLGIAPFKDI